NFLWAHVTGGIPGRISSDFGRNIAALGFLDSNTIAIGTGHRSEHGPGKFVLWDTTVEKPRQPVFQEPAGVRAVATHPPSRLVAWANGSRRVTVWDVGKPDTIPFNQSHSSPSLSFHPDGHLLAAAAERGSVVSDVA